MSHTHWIVNNTCSVLPISYWLKEFTGQESGFLESLITAIWIQPTKFVTMMKIELLDEIKQEIIHFKVLYKDIFLNF